MDRFAKNYLQDIWSSQKGWHEPGLAATMVARNLGKPACFSESFHSPMGRTCRQTKVHLNLRILRCFIKGLRGLPLHTRYSRRRRDNQRELSYRKIESGLEFSAVLLLAHIYSRRYERPSISKLKHSFCQIPPYPCIDCPLPRLGENPSWPIGFPTGPACNR